MGGLFSKPKIPTPQPQQIAAPPPPDVGTQAVQDAATSERQRLAGAKGRSSTILTATSDTVQPDAKKTLLGQ